MECGGFDAAFPALHCSEIELQSWESGVKPAALHRLPPTTVRLSISPNVGWHRCAYFSKTIRRNPKLQTEPDRLKAELQTSNCLQSNSVSRQLSMRFNARYNRFSIHERASSKRQAKRLRRQSASRKEESLNLRARLYGWRTFDGVVLVTVRHPSQTQRASLVRNFST